MHMDQEWRYCSIRGISEVSPEVLRLFLHHAEVLMYHGYGYWVHHICVMLWHFHCPEEKQLCVCESISLLQYSRNTLSVLNCRDINNFYVSIQILFVHFNLISHSWSKHFYSTCQNEYQGFDWILDEKGKGFLGNMSHFFSAAGIVTKCCCWQCAFKILARSWLWLQRRTFTVIWKQMEWWFLRGDDMKRGIVCKRSIQSRRRAGTQKKWHPKSC